MKDVADERPPETIGPYRILETLGEGGMGVVYLAEQREPIRRRVALKIVKLGMDTKEVLGRFETERQAMALMDHPNIAMVFEAGATATGRPFFVMELVNGVSITQYCDLNKLDLRARQQLFVATCRGIQHAHDRGVIHRDVKPGNVLVTLHDGRPTVKIIDFGLAKATNQRLTERTVFTEEGRLIGTPEYMSPEQAALTGLDVDLRTDVYSLGVLFYELMAGALPFDAQELRQAGYVEIQRRIREVDPPSPSRRVTTLGDGGNEVAARRRCDVRTLRSLLRHDLDAIAMRAMEKDRTRRYQTAAALADDVERSLRGEATLAKPIGVVRRGWRRLARHKGRNLAIAGGAAVVAGSVLFAVIQGNELERLRREHAPPAVPPEPVAGSDLAGVAPPVESLSHQLLLAETRQMVDALPPGACRRGLLDELDNVQAAMARAEADLQCNRAAEAALAMRTAWPRLLDLSLRVGAAGQAAAELGHATAGAMTAATACERFGGAAAEAVAALRHTHDGWLAAAMAREPASALAGRFDAERSELRRAVLAHALTLAADRWSELVRIGELLPRLGAGAAETDALQQHMATHTPPTLQLAVVADAARQVTRVTDAPADETRPTVSPDGAHVAFQSRHRDRCEIVTVDRSGHRTKVSDAPGHDVDPAWVPGSRSILFASDRTGRLCLWLSFAGTTCMVCDRPAEDAFAPAVAADGTVCFTATRASAGSKPWIEQRLPELLAAFRQARPVVWTLAIANLGSTRLVEGAMPAWSFDATRIAYCSDAAGDWDVWTMQRDGSGRTRVTTAAADQIAPCFSPDGRWLAYASNGGHDGYDLWIARTDGSLATRLTNDPGDELWPSWGVDGHLWFCGNASGNWDIWRLDPVLPQ